MRPTIFTRRIAPCLFACSAAAILAATPPQPALAQESAPAPSAAAGSGDSQDEAAPTDEPEEARPDEHDSDHPDDQEGEAMQPDSTESAMTAARLGDVLHQYADEIEGEEGRWQFTYRSVPMFGLTDETHDRMRFFAPIVRVEDMTDDQVFAVLDANFTTALDARYATNNGILFAVYLAPLSSITRNTAIRALEHVADLYETFGTTYQAGDLTLR